MCPTAHRVNRAIAVENPQINIEIVIAPSFARQGGVAHL
jgi:hypothetical protein